MADRMADGTITARWDTRTDKATSSIVDLNERRLTAHLEEHKQKDAKLEQDLRKGIGKMKSDLIERDNTLYQHSVSHHLYNHIAIANYVAVLIPILLSWPMRFLNFFFHWYTLNLCKDNEDIPYIVIEPADVVDPGRYKTKMLAYRMSLNDLKKTRRITCYHDLIISTMEKYQAEVEAHISHVQSKCKPEGLQ